MDEILKDLANYALDHKIGVFFRPVSLETVAQVNPRKRLIFINTNYKIKEQLPLQLAHEICHVMNGDDSLNRLYYSSSLYGVENQANIGALRMLAPYYIEDKPEEYITVDGFMETFAIPEHQRAIAEHVLFNVIGT